MTTTLAYIASKEQATQFKIETQNIPTIRVGIHSGLETDSDYFTTLGKALTDNKAGIDLVVFDQQSISKIVGPDKLVGALLNYVKKGISKTIDFVVIDQQNVINDKGRDLFTKYGIRVIGDIGELGPVFRVKGDIRNQQDSNAGVKYDNTGNVISGTVPDYSDYYDNHDSYAPFPGEDDPYNDSEFNDGYMPNEDYFDEDNSFYNKDYPSDPYDEEEEYYNDGYYNGDDYVDDQYYDRDYPPRYDHNNRYDDRYNDRYDDGYNDRYDNPRYNDPYARNERRREESYELDKANFDPFEKLKQQRQQDPFSNYDVRHRNKNNDNYFDSYNDDDDYYNEPPRLAPSRQRPDSNLRRQGYYEDDYDNEYDDRYSDHRTSRNDSRHSQLQRFEDERFYHDDYGYEDDGYDDRYDDGYNDGYDDKYDDEYDDGYDDYPDNRMALPSSRPSYNDDYDEYDDLTGGMSGYLNERDIQRLLSFAEPQWDYSELNADMESNSIFKKNRNKRLGEVSPSSFANSHYIQERKEQDGYYMPPNESKIISCFSCAGGTGKTTIATMISAQLNWYFNRDLMMNKTTSQSFRILCLSLNEFDDISVKDIGYDNLSGDEGDGKNVAELKHRIEECNGEPEWDDISHCFAASPSNYVFYLPSLTLRERLESKIDITAEDYKKIIEVCSRFFQFIVLDCPDTIYDQRNGLMEFAFRISDVILFIIEADTKNTIYLYRIFDGWRSVGVANPLERDKCMLVVNKYALSDNPYMPYNPERGQIPFKDIAKATYKYFCKIEAVPLTEYRSYGNILFGRDPKVKQAAADIADSILEMIDINDQRINKRRMRLGSGK